MLTAVRPHLTDEERALLTVASWWPQWTRTRLLLAVVAAMHLVAACVLTFAPDSQLVTQGTRPVFELLPKQLWAVGFLIGGIGAASLLLRFTGLRQLSTWITVLPAQAVWAGASLIAVLHGRGGAMGSLVFLPALFLFTVITAGVVAADFHAGKR